MDGLKKFAPSELKPKPIVSCLQTFPAFCVFFVFFFASFDWSSRLAPSFVIDQSGKLGFGYTTLN